MWQYPKDFDLFDQIGKYAKTAGVIFMILGLIGALYPVYASFATVVFVAWLMLIAGMFAGYFTYMTDRSDWAGWLKSVILIGVALYMLFSPLGGVATLGLLFSIYFFMDAFAGFTIASSTYPNKGWGIWVFNAVLSLIIAILFVIGWPFSSLYLIGLFVGFSLFFDGLALLMGGKFLKDISNVE
ncbi:HdeD family acid-resistance protein [Sulfurovum sp.]|uniref:HdeD family acid-resistance protein n=1 Tax=Sulfurovum sp. TaxID=1969726 RepID=UPI0025FA1AFE|nr:DUF308 domain-containing protein [Sulfurovum sp.]